MVQLLQEFKKLIRVYNFDNLISNLKSKEIGLDFNFKQAIQAVFWSKNNNNEIFNITIGYKGYPDGYFLQSPFVSITFKRIEEKLIHSSNKLDIHFNSEAYTIKKPPFNQGEFDFSVFDTKIDSEEKFDQVFKAEWKFIQIGAFPFFDKYQDLYNVAELLSSLRPQEVVPYIQGSTLFCKTILILQEANHPKFEEKRDEFYEVLKKQANKKEVYAQQLRLFELLFFTSLS